METNPEPPRPQETPQPILSHPVPAHTPGTVFSPTAQTPSTRAHSSSLSPNIYPPTDPVFFNEPLPSAQPPIPPLSSSQFSPPLPGKPSLRWLKLSPLALVAVIVLIVLGGSAAAYFGYYLPNQPANIWSTAMSRTGKGYDKLTSYAVKQTQSKNKGISLNGSFKVTGSLAADGSIQGSNDGTNGEFTGSVSAAGLKVDFDTRLIKSAAGTPDVYFKINGLQGLGTLLGGDDSPYSSVLNGIDGNWYFVDHSLFDSATGSSSSGLQLTSSDVTSILNAVGTASKQNLFTANPSKAVFVVKQNVGKEKQDGRSVYHFKVAVNKQNLKTYVTNLCTSLKNSSLKKFFNNDPATVSSTLGCDNAAASINGIDSAQTADVWVDMHTKLIHNIRFTDKSNSSNYFQIGQDYQGGSSFPFTLGFQDKSGGQTTSGGLTILLNTKTNSVTITGSAKGGSDFNASLNFSITPNNNPVKVEAPAGSKNIIQLLDDAGLSGILTGENNSAKDTKRKTDINALQGQIEAYDAENGYYPTLADINNAAWRDANMKGLDPSALQDPDGSAATIAAIPASDTYSYGATPAGCDNVATQCTSYTLTATLGSGGTYVKQALN